MKYAALFIWVLVPLGLWAVAILFGTPHIVGSYSFYDNGDPHNPRAPRRYIACTYHGMVGKITVPARDERCPWVRFFKEGS